jgi:hypothetical protein
MDTQVTSRRVLIGAESLESQHPHVKPIPVIPAKTDIVDTLTERGTRYGKFTGHAKITQGIKEVMHASPKWTELADDQKEALEMVAHKIGRILNGDPNYHDSWHDIVGYTKLVSDRLEGTER